MRRSAAWQHVSVTSHVARTADTYASIARSSSDGAVPASDTTTPAALLPSAWLVSCAHLLRSPPGATTWASTTAVGCSLFGSGALGKPSDDPDGGGVNTDSGSVGGALGPLRRAPKPGDGGTGGSFALMS